MFCILFWIKFFPHNLTQWFMCCFISAVMLYNVKSDVSIIFHGDLGEIWKEEITAYLRGGFHHFLQTEKINLANCLTPHTGFHRQLKVINQTKDSLLPKEPKISLFFTRNSLVPILNQIKPAHNLRSHCLEIHFKVILQRNMKHV